MGRIIRIVVPLLIIGSVAYVYRAPVSVFSQQLYRTALPCSIPIPYTIGTIDERFDIDRETLIAAAERAEKTWEDTYEQPLFVYAPDSATLTIDLVYDERQARTERLNELGFTIDDTLSTYEGVRAQYEAAQSAYNALRTSFERQSAELEKRIDTYETRVRSWNERGGAPREVYAELEAERIAIAAESKRVNALAERVNTQARDVNALANTANRLAKTVNATAAEFNNDTSDEEFEEAVFESRPGRESITVYEFDTIQRLTRVLAHEFGHSLGLDHVPDAEAIMYRLNAGKSLTTTSADSDELRRVCRVASIVDEGTLKTAQ